MNQKWSLSLKKKAFKLSIRRTISINWLLNYNSVKKSWQRLQHKHCSYMKNIVLSFLITVYLSGKGGQTTPAIKNLWSITVPRFLHWKELYFITQSLITFLKLVKLNLTLSPVEAVLARLRTDISSHLILRIWFMKML